MASFLKPLSTAYLAAATPCSASDVIVRKKMPLVLPSRPSAVSVGDEEAGEIWTTFAGAVTEVRIGIDTDEMIPPMMTGTFFTCTSCVAASTATLPWLWLSRVSVTRSQPRTPPAALRSRKAISTDLAPAWPYSPAGPVSSMTRPTVILQSAALAMPAAEIRPRAVVTERSVFFMIVPLVRYDFYFYAVILSGLRCLQPGFLQMPPLDARWRR